MIFHGLARAWIKPYYIYIYLLYIYIYIRQMNIHFPAGALLPGTILPGPSWVYQVPEGRICGSAPIGLGRVKHGEVVPKRSQRDWSKTVVSLGWWLAGLALDLFLERQGSKHQDPTTSKLFFGANSWMVTTSNRSTMDGNPARVLWEPHLSPLLRFRRTDRCLVQHVAKIYPPNKLFLAVTSVSLVVVLWHTLTIYLMACGCQWM